MNEEFLKCDGWRKPTYSELVNENAAKNKTILILAVALAVVTTFLIVIFFMSIAP